MTDLKSMTLQELEDLIAGSGEKKFRAAQIYKWLHKDLCMDAEEMTNLPKTMRQKINDTCIIKNCQIEERQISKLDGTTKYLFRLQDGNAVEGVFLKYHHGDSVCISSQAGCRMGCRFCASTVGGLKRNLTPGEMLDEVYSIQKDKGERISNIIIMGIGEPFDNYDNIIRFLHLIKAPEGLNISPRNITISTCGLVPYIKRFADEGLPVTLAISLHAPFDAMRQKMMPIANKYSISEIMDAVDYYIEKTGRRLTLEYTLIHGTNDTEECAEKLSQLVHGRLIHVNLIPLNKVEGRYGERPDADEIEAFKFLLEKLHINVTIRRGMGRDIDAACGMLRNKKDDI
ncbi:MAG: 23S rRNA (adenine(2503)-C(2))-methyltransferase RlmN [Lachnospiraceae bacterium]|jgi:23S rRNA (adenine2503-C2)-methyltransferase|nr:23S rRNA (adenine(2503)-C(2))-methyltransferase RlmN [Lachnospiraceae bacterium]MEE3460497.1 23S rRNA (adenine(2503)-C(2))-methyltransferase RlmN [Lachnospiraceae bacterium]